MVGTYHKEYTQGVAIYSWSIMVGEPYAEFQMRVALMFGEN